MDGDVLPGEGRRQSDVLRIRDGNAVGLSDARWPIRKLVRAARRYSFSSACAHRAVLVLSMLQIDNNLYTQIGIILLIALSAKNAILIVEVALELHVRERKPLLESAVDAARARFRPILMTSFA